MVRKLQAYALEHLAVGSFWYGASSA